jgi:SAM-dependent methyltransferase
MGLEVEGSDISSNMIERAKATFGEPHGLRWAVRGFNEPPEPGSFDAVICIGNSLALAADPAAAAGALRQMFSATRSGSMVNVHVLYLWKFPSGPCVWQKLTRGEPAQAASFILKGVHRCLDEGYVELVVGTVDVNEPPIRARSIRFLGMHVAELELVSQESAADVLFFGDHQCRAYDADNSADLIMVAFKG